MMLPLPAAVALERAIEAVLKLDPETRARLAALDGKLVRFEVASPDIDVVLGVVDGRVSVPSRHDGEVDATVAGSLAALRSLARSNDALLRGDVRLSGDVSVGVALRDAVKGIDVDWQERLSPLLGDAVVHRLDRAASGASAWLGRSRAAMRENARDWFEDEAELVATADEVAGFGEGVDAARERGDRLEARLRSLERGRAEGPAPQGPAPSDAPTSDAAPERESTEASDAPAPGGGGSEDGL